MSAANLNPDFPLTSGIIPMVYQYLELQGDCQVVDFGTATNNKFSVFSHNNTKVYFDTTDRSLRAKILAERGLCEISQADLESCLSNCPDKVDVLLLWDLLDYMSLDSIAALSRVLTKRMPVGALVYCMVSQQKLIPSTPAAIDILSPSEMTIQIGPEELEAPRYSPKVLESKFPGFRIEKLYLLQNGIQEHLFFHEGTVL